MDGRMLMLMFLDLTWLHWVLLRSCDALFGKRQYLLQQDKRMDCLFESVFLTKKGRWNCFSWDKHCYISLNISHNLPCIEDEWNINGYACWIHVLTNVLNKCCVSWKQLFLARLIYNCFTSSGYNRHGKFQSGIKVRRVNDGISGIDFPKQWPIKINKASEDNNHHPVQLSCPSYYDRYLGRD